MPIFEITQVIQTTLTHVINAETPEEAVSKKESGVRSQLRKDGEKLISETDPVQVA